MSNNLNNLDKKRETTVQSRDETLELSHRNSYETKDGEW